MKKKRIILALSFATFCGGVWAFRKEAYAYCVGQIISDARKREKVTQQELAQRVGTNKSYISRIENGSVEPGAGMFLRILSALGLRFEVSQPLALG